MSDFSKFAAAIKARFDSMSKHELFVTVEDRDAVWDHYLAAFPEGTNPIYRTRTEHDCGCCRNFVRNLGNVVAIIEGKLQSVWSVPGLEYPFDVVAASLAQLVESKPITALFRSTERAYGSVRTVERLADGTAKEWNHFHACVADRHVSKITAQVVGEYSTSAQVFRRGLEEIAGSAVTTVLDLMAQKSLYRGDEFKPQVVAFSRLQAEYRMLAAAGRNAYIWEHAEHPVARLRNTAIGTLLQDLSAGEDLEAAVKSFEAKVAPTNYKRPTALITPKMIDAAMQTIRELGLEEALQRRFARLSDVSVNNVLWVDNSAQAQMKGGLHNLLMSAVVAPKPAESKARDISMEDFMSSILPQASAMELYVSNSLQSNFMSLTAPVFDDVGRLFKWNNNFAWSYDGNIADSDIRRAVQGRGGRVDGVFRFSHSWNYDKRNASLMDLHVFMPGSDIGADNGIDDLYGNQQRVGWNHRNHHASGGTQDVDYTDPAPEGYVPVENITFPSLEKLREGKYICKVHNWKLRTPTKAGFRAEIEFGGQVYEYEHKEPMDHKQWITVAVVTLKDGKFSIDHRLPCSSSSQQKWGISTESFVKVQTLLNSPNHWDGNQTGNKHWFFILEGCRTDTPMRGIYNEFLKPELEKHRKVFEVLGDKTKCQPTDEQLSGIGLSSTRGDTVLVRVTGDKVGGLFNVQF